MKHDPLRTERSRELRRHCSSAETILWRAIRSRGIGGVKFRRQQPLGPFFADFFAPSLRLVLEVDGDSHADRKVYDDSRQRWLEGQGLRVVRVTNDDVYQNLEGVLEQIGRECATTPSLLPEAGGPVGRTTNTAKWTPEIDRDSDLTGRATPSPGG